MNPTCRMLSIYLAALSTAAGCDLDELSQQPAPDGMPAADSAPVPTVDASDGDPSPVDATVADAFVDDPTIPRGAQLGSCNPAAWTTSASESHPVNPPAHAIDGLLPSRWSTGSAQSTGQYLDIDFGGFVLVDQVAIESAYAADGVGDYPRGVEILASYDDGSGFARFLGGASPGSVDPGPILTVAFPVHAARHLRLRLTQGAPAGNWWTIHELRVGCTLPPGTPDTGSPDAGTPGGDGGLDPNRAAWSATASHSSAADPAAGALDGNATSRWASGKNPQYGDEWFRLDLGGVFNIREVRLVSNATDYPSAYQLELSTDDATFAPAAIGLGSEVTQILFAPRDARYLRIRQIGSGFDHWWGISELSILQ